MAVMADMFVGVDRSMIEMMLRKHGGHMEAAIDELLALRREEVEARAQVCSLLILTTHIEKKKMLLDVD